MACAITSGRLDFSCKTLVGGLKAIYVASFDENNFSAITDGATTITASTDIFKFELLNDGNTFDQSNEVAKDAGTSIFTQTGTFVLKGQDMESQVALQELSKARTQVIVEFNNGDMVVAGLEYGCDFTIGTASGGARADLKGYNVAFTASEQDLAPWITDISGATEGSTIDPVA